ncbi:MAG: sporulation protein YtxC [Bacillota bacterium]
MLQTVSIATSQHVDFVRQLLKKEQALLLGRQMAFNYDESNIGDYTFWVCSLYPLLPEKNDRNTPDRLTSIVARMVSQLINEKYSLKFFEKLIASHYYYFKALERAQIMQKALDLMTEMDNQSRLDRLQQKVNEYLEANGNLIIEGFVNFRLHEYLDDLEGIVDQAVELYLAEKEYNEFILLLKYFVEMQDPRVDKVHVLLGSTGYFQLYDEDENIVHNDYLQSFVVDLVDTDINYEDLLISALITIAPQKIILHIPELDRMHSTLETLKNVFANRISFCQGCIRCLNFVEWQGKNNT